MSKQETLKREILNLSVAKLWEVARQEWALHEVIDSEEPETCLCGHYPILELCVLRNTVNRNLATVGNCCVKRFIGLPSDKIFQAIKRVRKDAQKSLNAEAVGYAFDRGWINDWERKFYSDMVGKRSLSPRQLAKRMAVNERVLGRVRRHRPA